MTFSSLGLKQVLLKAIAAKGYSKPTPIQAKAIPKILQGRDVLASAQTGTGKTAGFALPVLDKLLNNTRGGKAKTQVLVLTPTRELAAQVGVDFKDYSRFTRIKTTVIFGGVSANKQINALKQGSEVVIATPGRLLDLYERKAFSFDNIKFFVLDEADRMLDMGFSRDIDKILALLPTRRQNLLFSATFSKEIKKLAGQFLFKPAMIAAHPQNTTARKVDQLVYRTDKGKKTELLIHLIKKENWTQALVFTRTKHGANRLSQKLEKAGIKSAAIHGNKSQGARTKALAGFKAGKVRMLVATDIAARGLDIPLLPHVVNYELPNVPEDYVHRIGRTGRAGASGQAISLVSIDEDEYVTGIEKLLEEKLDGKVLAGFEPTETLKELLDKKAANKQQHRAGGRKSRHPSRGFKNTSQNSKSSKRNNFRRKR